MRTRGLEGDTAILETHTRKVAIKQGSVAHPAYNCGQQLAEEGKVFKCAEPMYVGMSERGVKSSAKCQWRRHVLMGLARCNVGKNALAEQLEVGNRAGGACFKILMQFWAERTGRIAGSGQKSRRCMFQHF